MKKNFLKLFIFSSVAVFTTGSVIAQTPEKPVPDTTEIPDTTKVPTDTTEVPDSVPKAPPAALESMAPYQTGFVHAGSHYSAIREEMDNNGLKPQEAIFETEA